MLSSCAQLTDICQMLSSCAQLTVMLWGIPRLSWHCINGGAQNLVYDFVHVVCRPSDFLVEDVSYELICPCSAYSCIGGINLWTADCHRTRRTFNFNLNVCSAIHIHVRQHWLSSHLGHLSITRSHSLHNIGLLSSPQRCAPPSDTVHCWILLS